MTGEAVRDTQFAKWIDEDAWMERMKGNRWNAVLKEENEYANAIISAPAVQSRIGLYRALYNSVREKTQGNGEHYICGSAIILEPNGFIKRWRFKDAKESDTKEARDIIAYKDDILVTKDVGDGSEQFELQYWRRGGKNPIWKRRFVGPDIGILGDRVYYLGVKHKLMYYQLFSCNVRDGSDEKLIYTEINQEVNLSLEKQPGGRLLFVRDNSQDTEYYRIRPQGFTKTERFIIPSEWIMPLGDYGICFLWKEMNILITKAHGKKTLWRCSSTQSPKKLIEVLGGNLDIDPYSAWEGNTRCLVKVEQPTTYTLYYILTAKNLEQLHPIIKTQYQAERICAISRDGTKVYGLITRKRGVPIKNLMAIGYGSYGIETFVGNVYGRWAPLLENNWTTLHTFIRGGGDHTVAWGKMGRRGGKEKTIEDFEALIRCAQKLCAIPPRNSVIYGRSAGGLLVGATLSRNASGGLVRGVYTEVPYVDELRTTTNKDLPLTTLEYNEFGAPTKHLEDFIDVGLLSPADSARVINAQNVFVLARTAENDSQVYTYEPVKWVRRLRSKGSRAAAPKALIIEKNMGHFTPPDVSSLHWSIDCAILDAWISNE